MTSNPCKYVDYWGLN